MFSHFSLQRLALRLYPRFLIAVDISSHSGPFGTFSWYLLSSCVRRVINAFISAFGQRDDGDGPLVSRFFGGGGRAGGGSSRCDGGGGC